MLNTVIALADRLLRWRVLLATAAAAGLALFGLGLFAPGFDSSGRAGLAGLVLLIWASFLIAVGHFFAGRQWSGPAPGGGVFAWLRGCLVLCSAWLAVLVAAVLAGLLVLFTLRALSAI